MQQRDIDSTWDDVVVSTSPNGRRSPHLIVEIPLEEAMLVPAEPLVIADNIVQPVDSQEDVPSPEDGGPRERRAPRRYGEWVYPRGRNFFAGMVGGQQKLVEPETYMEAMQSPEVEQWQHAMRQEIDSLKKNGTWKLVELPQGRHTIKNKWVYKLKFATDGSVARFKARLVAKGFTQREGVDYFETFSPVAKFDSIRAILSIAAADNFLIKQFDVETAFLYGEIEEEIFMTQPTGFIDPEYPKSVCKVLKSIYGLRQSACNWNITFTENLRRFGLQPTCADPCVFVGGFGPSKIVLAIFVMMALFALWSK